MASGRVLRSPCSGRLAEQLAHLLVTARGDRPRTQFAAAAGVSYGTIADVETGRANPTLAYLEALGPLYGVRLQITAEPE